MSASLACRSSIDGVWSRQVASPSRQATKFLSLLLACTEPKQAVQNQSVLHFVGEGQGELFIGLLVEVKVVVPHVEVEHTVSQISPNDWIIAAVRSEERR